MVTPLPGVVRSHFRSTYYSNRPVFPTILPFLLTWNHWYKKKRKRVEFLGAACTGEIASFVSRGFHVPELNKLYYIHPGEQVHRPEISPGQGSDNLLQGILTWVPL